MIIGKFIPGSFRATPAASYLAAEALSVPHQIYELRITTAPMAPDRERWIAESLAFIQMEGMNVIAVQAQGSTVRMQVTGSPFFWAPFLAILPSIIVPLVALIIGIIIAIRIPEWAWATVPILLGSSVFIYALYKAKK